MKLGAIMNRYPQTALPNDSLIHARRIMLKGGFHHLPVLDSESERVVGVLTESDITRHQARVGQSIWSTPTDSVEMAMNVPVHTAGPDDSLTAAAARMIAEGISCLPITVLGKLVGIVTTADVLASEVEEELHGEQAGPLVADIMTRNPYSVFPEDRLLDAAARMSQYRVRHLPVVNVDSRVVGMLSDRDVRGSIGEPAQALSDESSVPATLLHVRDAMSEPAIIVRSDQSCSEVAHALAKLGASTVPVIDGDGLLVGILSYVDLLRGFTA